MLTLPRTKAALQFFHFQLKMYPSYTWQSCDKQLSCRHMSTDTFTRPSRGNMAKTMCSALESTEPSSKIQSQYFWFTNYSLHDHLFGSLEKLAWSKLEMSFSISNNLNVIYWILISKINLLSLKVKLKRFHSKGTGIWKGSKKKKYWARKKPQTHQLF